MNDFAELEAELKRLRPAAVNAELITRLEHSLGDAAGRTAEQVPAVIPTAVEESGGATFKVLPRDPSLGMTGDGASSLRPQRKVNWLPLGLSFAAAAAVVLLARTQLDRPVQQQPTLAVAKPATLPATPVSAQSFVPDGLTRVVYNRSDEGLVFPSAAETPLRRVRSRSRETLQWKNPDTGASLRVSYPTDEVEFIPVSVQ